MAITYSAVNNTITVTGYSSATPCTFLDLWNADQAGGWNKITRQCSNQYCIKAYIVIGDSSASTWFSDKNQQIIYETAFWTNWAYLWVVKNNGNLQFGEVLSATEKTGHNGCAFLNLETTINSEFIGKESNTAILKMYGCYVRTERPWFIYGPSELFSCLGTKNFIVDCRKATTVSISKFVSLVANRAIYLYSDSHLVELAENVSSENCVYGIGFSHYAEGTAKNCYNRNSSTSDVFCYGLHYDQKIINYDTDGWLFTWQGSDYGKKVYRQYEFDVTVIQENLSRTPIVNATVKIWDLNNNLVVDTTTDVNGKIATQILNYGYYHPSGGNTPVIQTPHKIEIRKSSTDFLTVTKYMSMEYKRKEVISMVDMTDLRNDIAACQTDLDNPDQYKADVSGLATSTALATVQADLDDPDQYKADVSGLATESTVTKIWNKIKKGKGILKLK